MEPKYFEVIKKYDAQSDSLYIHIDNEYEYQESIEMSNNVILDFDSNSMPVALEVLDASKFFNVNKLALKRQFKTQIRIRIKEDSIHLNAVFKFLVHNKEYTSPLVQDTINDINAPLLETSFNMVEV